MVLERVGDYDPMTAASHAVGAQLGIAGKALRRWVAQSRIDIGAQTGVTSTDSEEIRALKAEAERLREANEILRQASILFARELDPHRR